MSSGTGLDSEDNGDEDGEGGSLDSKQLNAETQRILRGRGLTSASELLS